jgi:hypothetical protein
MNDKKRGIGSKQAAKLARERFGDKAYVKRQGKYFFVGQIRFQLGGYCVDAMRGFGKSWETALKDAGISIPVNEPYFPPVKVEGGVTV